MTAREAQATRSVPEKRPDFTTRAVEEPVARIGLPFLSVLAFAVGIGTGLGAVVFRDLIGLVHNLLFLGQFTVRYDVREDDVAFEVIQRIWRKRAVMAVVVRGRGVPRPANIAGVITKENVPDSVAASVQIYPS